MYLIVLANNIDITMVFSSVISHDFLDNFVLILLMLK